MKALAAALAVTAALALPAGAAAVSETTSFQGDAAHTGGVVDPALDGTLRVRWSRALTRGTSEPLVADGRVLALSPGPNGTSDVVALDAATGAELWRRTVDSPEDGTWMTYGGGAVYVLKQFGTLIAFDAATGAPRWSRDRATFEVSTVRTAPVYFAGTVFYNGMNSASQSRIVAVAAADGTPLWESAALPYQAWDAAVAVDAQGVFLSNECGYASSWTLAGVERWETTPGCPGNANGPSQTVVAGARTFPAFTSGAVLDTATGATVDEFVRPLYGAVPAFGPSHAAVLRDGQLVVADRATLTTVGHYVPPSGELLAQPFFVGDRVFTVDDDHHLIGVDAATATLSADVDLNTQLAPLPGPQPESAQDGGIGAGGGVIAVATADGRVVAVTAADEAPTAPVQAEVRPAAQPEVRPARTDAAPGVAAIPAAARRVTFPDGARLRALSARGLVLAVTGARAGATVRATLTVGGRVVWRATRRVPRSGRLRLKVATRARTARLELQVSAARAAPLVLRRTLR
jgi:outer membrane protein assembly factor BamB